MLLLVAIQIFTFSHLAFAIDYCADNMRCDGIQNSGCDCNFGPKCKAPREHPLTDEIRKSILQAHNRYREKIASGAETRGGIKGGATEMFALQYNNGLEHTATCWNKKCTFGHDKCRITDLFRPAGQNIYWSSGKACEWEYNLSEAARLWYEEVQDFTPSCLKSYGVGCVTSKVGHFSQMVWAKTTHVGCSLVEYGGASCQITCNYGPAGNFQTEPVFLEGEPASKCKYKSEIFKNLCLLSSDQESEVGTGNTENPAEEGGDRNSGDDGQKSETKSPSVAKRGHKKEDSGGERNNAQFIIFLFSVWISFIML